MKVIASFKDTEISDEPLKKTLSIHSKSQLSMKPKRFSLFDLVATRINATKFTKHIRKNIEKKKNMAYIRELSKANLLSKGEKYEPKVSEKFLEEWLDFPRNTGNNWVLLNTFTLMTKWLLWTNKSIASLDPASPSIRDRLSNTISVLSTACGLFLVMAFAAFVVPPEPKHGSEALQHILLNVYGILLFTSMVCSLFYIGYALTALYPVLQSIRDDIAFDGFEHLKRGLGGFELMLFNVSMHALALSFFIAAYLIYSWYALITMVIISILVYALVLALTRDMFISLDPISSMHLGLSNDPSVAHRAELMAQYILRSIPNHLLDEQCVERRASKEFQPHHMIHMQQQYAWQEGEEDDEGDYEGNYEDNYEVDDEGNVRYEPVIHSTKSKSLPPFSSTSETMIVEDFQPISSNKEKKQHQSSPQHTSAASVSVTSSSRRMRINQKLRMAASQMSHHPSNRNTNHNKQHSHHNHPPSVPSVSYDLMTLPPLPNNLCQLFSLSYLESSKQHSFTSNQSHLSPLSALSSDQLHQLMHIITTQAGCHSTYDLLHLLNGFKEISSNGVSCNCHLRYQWSSLPPMKIEIKSSTFEPKQTDNHNNNHNNSITNHNSINNDSSLVTMVDVEDNIDEKQQDNQPSLPQPSLLSHSSDEQVCITCVLHASTCIGSQPMRWLPAIQKSFPTIPPFVSLQLILFLRSYLE